ncbi:zinc finger protein 39-like [Folsomia candida]|uniref:zinc finger protein 39-like n=1 Tax=Folsomia candida TaxID=158441 RepID=UPI00160544B9|nr:zinc finger protein 39-like [Folsomia candida]
MESSRNGLACSTCLKIFTTKKTLRNHMFTHAARVKCETCRQISKNPPALSAHIKMIHTNRDRPSCDTCHRVFYTSAALRIHINAVHSTIERPRFPCGFPDCDKSYLSKSNVSKHIKTAHTENPTTLCGNEFKTKENLEIFTHTTEKAYPCATCGRSFSTYSKRKLHEATHFEKSTRRIFKRELCVRTFLHKGYLQRHVQIVHGNRRNRPCTFCEKRFSSSTDLRRHEEAKHAAKIHSCDKCEFGSHSKRSLANHAWRHNPANRRECYFCKKQFVCFSNLVTDCRRHTIEKVQSRRFFVVLHDKGPGSPSFRC